MRAHGCLCIFLSSKRSALWQVLVCVEAAKRCRCQTLLNLPLMSVEPIGEPVAVNLSSKEMCPCASAESRGGGFVLVDMQT